MTDMDRRASVGDTDPPIAVSPTLRTRKRNGITATCDDRMNAGMPTDPETGIALRTLWRQLCTGDSLSEVAAWYRVPEAAVRRAIRWYRGAGDDEATGGAAIIEPEPEKETNP